MSILKILHKHFGSQRVNMNSTINCSSLVMLHIVIECEKLFNIDLPDQEMRDIGTVGQFVEFVEKKIMECK